MSKLHTLFAGTFVERALGFLRPAPQRLDRSGLFTDFETKVLNHLIEMRAAGPDGVPIVGVKADMAGNIRVMCHGEDRRGYTRKFSVRFNTVNISDRHYMGHPRLVAEAAFKIMGQSTYDNSQFR